MKRIITLTTDFGLKDSYVGQMKGVILKVNPEASIVDVTHDIPAWDIFKGAFVLSSFYRYFPKGTIHLVILDPGVGTGRKALLIQTQNCLFVGPDNGVFTFIYQRENINQIIQIENRKFFLEERSNTFHGCDVFAPVAAYLSLGMKIGQFGSKAHDCVKLEIPSPVIKKDGITGKIVYIDSFGNLITNISGENLWQLSNRELEINVGKRKIRGISRSYFEAGAKGILALVGSSGFLEISAREDRADRILNKKIGDKVILRLKTL